MRELLELRIPMDDADRFLPPGLGKPGTIVRRLVLNTQDPWVDKLRAIEGEYQVGGRTLFTMCEVKRLYTPRELQVAEYLKIECWPFFMPSGEQCGTVYDDARACPHCGSNAPQLGELRLEVGRIPKSRDLAFTPGAEFIVSSRLAKAMRSHRISGYQLRPVISRGGRPTDAWHQLIIPTASARAIAPTVFGSDYLTPEPDSARCVKGHVLGSRLLSPLHLARSSLADTDWQCMYGLLGRRQGVFRPYPLFIISQRLYQLLKELKVRHLNEEVAHLS